MSGRFPFTGRVAWRDQRGWAGDTGHRGRGAISPSKPGLLAAAARPGHADWKAGHAPRRGAVRDRRTGRGAGRRLRRHRLSAAAPRVPAASQHVADMAGSRPSHEQN